MKRLPLTRAIAHLAADFDCGTATTYQTEVAEWIRSPAQEVWEEIDNGRLQVWLYFTETGELIGFASLGLQEIDIADTPPQSQEVLMVPYYGVQAKFHKKPDGPWQHYYSRQIFADLLSEARHHPTRKPLLFLYVHPDNKGAIRLYEQFGFIPCGSFAGYLRMKKDLTLPDAPVPHGPSA